MTRTTERAALRTVGVPITGLDDDYSSLLERIGDAKYVLLGEATHGTHEFYAERARITQLLIREKGFHGVAIEGDWPDAHRVHRHVTGRTQGTAADALGGFKRFPTWMWRNKVVVSFINWLRAHNAGLSSGAPKVGFYGLDLYSLYGSIEAILTFLSKVDPDAAVRARARYGCFDHFGNDTRMYGYSAGLGISESCEQEVLEQLQELSRRTLSELANGSEADEEERFHAEQNARLVKNAEEYYRTMFRGSVSSWNLRDRHMAETLELVTDHLDGKLGDAKLVVWAHNSHVGDARATAMTDAGELNLGQLVREKDSARTFILGFTTYDGTVTAASDWDAPAELKEMRPALPESHEALLHECSDPRMLFLMDDPVVHSVLGTERIQRAIGVVYRPDTERRSHYFEARLTEQFDALIHIDRTRAIEPLERFAVATDGESPETYPFSV